MKRELSPKEQKILCVVSVAAFVVISILLVIFIGLPIIRTARDPVLFREHIEKLGVWGKLAYVGLCFIQVVIALIPGGPIEVAGGYAFGHIEATVLSTIGLGLGSITVFLLVRKFGVKLIEVFFTKEKIAELGFLKTNKKRDLIVFLLFLAPGTPKDLISYFCGLTDINIWFFFLVSTFARIPAAFFSSMGGAAAGEKSYLTAILTAAVIVVFTISGIFLYKHVINKNRKEGKHED